MAYKIVQFDGSNVSIAKDNMSIPRSSDNRHYQMFIEDIALGNDTVEGPDVVEPSYVELRAAAYPSMVDQLDMQYWDGINGTTTWGDAIQAVKDEYPTTITGGTTVGDVPDWVQEEADAWLAKDQLIKYTDAVERLSKYVLADGQEEVTQDIVVRTENVLGEDGMPTMDENGDYIMQDVTETIIVSHAIPALEATVTRTVYDENDVATEETIENPLITEDNAERAEAQAVVDATPQSVIDTYNGE